MPWSPFSVLFAPSLVPSRLSVLPPCGMLHSFSSTAVVVGSSLHCPPVPSLIITLRAPEPLVPVSPLQPCAELGSHRCGFLLTATHSS